MLIEILNVYTVRFLHNPANGQFGSIDVAKATEVVNIILMDMMLWDWLF